MFAFSSTEPLQVDQAGHVTLVRWTDPTPDVPLIRQAFQQIDHLVEEGRHRIALDLSRLRQGNSYLIGKLVGLHQRIFLAGGRLVCFGVAPEVWEATFQPTRLDEVLEFCPDEPAALDAFHHHLRLDRRGPLSIVRFKTTVLFGDDLAEEIDADLNQLVESGTVRLLLNCHKVRIIGSRLIGNLIRINRTLQQRGGGLRFCQISPVLYQDLFEVAGIDRIFPNYPTEAQALAGWGES